MLMGGGITINHHKWSFWHCPYKQHCSFKESRWLPTFQLSRHNVHNVQNCLLTPFEGSVCGDFGFTLARFSYHCGPLRTLVFLSSVDCFNGFSPFSLFGSLVERNVLREIFGWERVIHVLLIHSAPECTCVKNTLVKYTLLKILFWKKRWGWGEDRWSMCFSILLLQAWLPWGASSVPHESYCATLYFTCKLLCHSCATLIQCAGVRQAPQWWRKEALQSCSVVLMPANSVKWNVELLLSVKCIFTWFREHWSAMAGEGSTSVNNASTSSPWYFFFQE